MKKKTSSDSERRGQVLAVIAAVIGLLTAVIGLTSAYVEYGGKKRAEQQANQQKVINDNLQETNNELNKKYADLEVKALPAFLGRYDEHVADLKKTVSRYQEATEGKAEAENEVLNSAQAFLSFAVKWRRVTRSYLINHNKSNWVLSMGADWSKSSAWTSPTPSGRS